MTESRAIARPGSGAESDAGSHREVLSPEQREASQADPQRVTLRPSAYTLSDVEEDGGAPRTGAKPLIVSALILILVFFGGGLYWAATAPLSSAAIAPGVVTVAGNRKTIQHLEGGIVQDILVQEGDQVSAGQPLIELDDTKARAVLTPLRGQYYAALALRARLTAEWEDHDTIDFPEPLLARAGEPAVAQIMARQQDVFESRRETLQSKIAVTEQQIKQLEQRIEGYHGQIETQLRQLALLERELGSLRALSEKGLVRQSRLLALQRDQAELEGAILNNETQIATSRQNAEEVRMRTLELRNERSSEVAESLRAVEDRLAELQEALLAAEDVMRRTTIAAPIDGRIVDLKVHTVGGVILPGRPLMDIVPTDDKLIIDAKVDPKDRDVVRTGLLAEVRFTAFSKRTAVPVKATVLSVSADRLEDKQTGLHYYLARIELLEDPSKALGGASIHPGMQSEVMIVTGQRTALSYILRPVTRSLNRALKDQ